MIKSLFSKFLVLLSGLLLLSNLLVAQCANNNAYWTDLTPGGVGLSATTSVMYGGEYCTVTVCQGANYTFSTCSAGYDTQLTLYSSTGTYLAYDDDGCAPGSYISWTATFSGTVWILLDQYNCLSNSTNTTLTVTQTTACAGGGTICDCDGDIVDEGALAWLGDGFADDNSYTYNGVYVNFNCATWGYDCGDIPGSPTSDPYGVCFGFLPPNNGCGITSCSNLDLDFVTQPCEDNGFGLLPVVTLDFLFNGGCQVTDVCIDDGTGYICYDVTAYGLYSGNVIDFINLPEDSFVYFYYVLDDGSVSSEFLYYTGSCAGCANLDSDAYWYQCIGTQAETDFYYYFTGGCTVDEFCIWVDGELPTCYPVTSFDASGDYFTLYLNLPDTWYYYYYTLDDGSVSGTFAYYNGYCGDEFCSNLDSDAYDAGCQDYLGTDVPVADFYFYYSGDCMVTDICIAADGLEFDCYDLTADLLYSGDYTSFFLFSENTLYDYYYVLDDGSISPIFTYFNGECAGTECDDAYVYLAPDCWGSEVSWDITDAFGNLIYTAAEGTYSDGLPTGTGEWVSALCLDPGCYYFNIYDAFGDGMAGAQYIECDVDGYYYMTDGVGNILFTMPTASYGYGTSHFFCISEGGCDNLSGFFTEGECDFTGVDPILPWDFDFVFDGDCIVQEFCISENGGAYTCYDVSGFALVSGEGVVYTIGTPNTNYEVYYTLSDGTVSSSFFFTTGSCDAEFTICDCDGTVHTGGVLSWLGDGFADDGTYQWEGQYVNFNCSTWGYDCGDIADAPSDDPYGVCSGNLPPANGCIDDPLCETYTFYLTTDCYPDETGFNVYDEFGNIVAYIEPGALIDTYTTYTWSLCLPEGCYTFELTDAFGDGLEGIGNGCTADGDFWYYDPDGNLAFVLDDPNFGDFLTTEECVVLPYTCTNLGLELYQEPCGDFDGSLEPIIGLTFSFDGDCVVTELCWSEDGGAYTCQDVTEFGWSDGDSGILSPTTPDATYYFYYTLDDGSYSPVFIFENGNCDNEPVICDCNGTQHTIGVLAWLGDGFADDGGYTWLGQFVDFNCSTWGYDCGDIAGTPDLDPYNVCGGGLPPNNGCDIEEEVLGCTDPDALNYNPLATLEDGSCLYDTFAGCTDETACNYNPVAVEDDGSCEYVSCAGCTDNEALNFDPTATIDDGSCIYDDIEGCTDEEALNYNPLANVDDGSCEYSCTFPELVFDSFCEEGDEDNFYITIYVGDLGNGAPYTLSNTYDDQQVTLNFSGSINMGPFPVDASVVIQVVSNTLDGCFITSPVLNEDCSTGIISGCTDILATNYYPSATVDDGSCIYDFQICDCDGVPFSPDERFRLGDGNADTGAGSSPNFNCQAWGWDCGDIAGTPDEDPYGVCDGNVPEELIATAIGCPVGVYDIEGFSGYSIYPNPNNGTFNILNSTNESEVEIRIYDATGRLAFSQVAYIPQRSVMSIATGNLSYGTYTLELRNRNFTEHHKLVIE